MKGQTYICAKMLESFGGAMEGTLSLLKYGRTVLIGLAALAFGCTGGETELDGQPATPTASGGSSSGGSGGSAAAGGSGGSTAVGGSGGGAPAGGSGGTGGDGGNGGGATTGRPGMALVTGGGLCKSASYTAWFTMGESPGGNGKMQTSTSYQHMSGLIATTQP